MLYKIRQEPHLHASLKCSPSTCIWKEFVTTLFELHRENLTILGRLSGEPFHCFETAHNAEIEEISVIFSDILAARLSLAAMDAQEH
jgi:hypothetical protein